MYLEPISFISVILISAVTTECQAAFQFRELEIRGINALRNGDFDWGDIDRDGDFDIVTTGNQNAAQSQPVSRYYVNRGYFVEEGGEFDDIYGLDFSFSDGLTGLWRSSIALGDYDGDGDLDLIESGIDEVGNRLAILYENTGAAFDTFVRVSSWKGLSDGDAEWADFDNDGDIDLVLSGIDDDSIPRTILYENHLYSDQREFIPMSIPFRGLAVSDLEWGDFDNDKDLDLLATGNVDPPGWEPYIYGNEGSGVFTERRLEHCEMYGASAAWGDYDSDGDLDLLVSGGVISPFLIEGEFCLLTNERGHFTISAVEFLGRFVGDSEISGRYAGSAGWGDFNNDGNLDFFINGSESPVSALGGQVYEYVSNMLYVKPGNEQHSSIQTPDSGRIRGAAYGSTLWGDVDNDEDLDLLIQGIGPGGFPSILGYENYRRDYARNEPPLPPADLTSTVAGRTVELTWSPGFDLTASSPKALSYNLRVGTSSGTNDVVASMSNPESGVRYVSRLGNAQLNLGWWLGQLEPGTYYWSVQSIDNSLTGSAFSAEAQFVVAH